MAEPHFFSGSNAETDDAQRRASLLRNSPVAPKIKAEVQGPDPEPILRAECQSRFPELPRGALLLLFFWNKL